MWYNYLISPQLKLPNYLRFAENTLGLYDNAYREENRIKVARYTVNLVFHSFSFATWKSLVFFNSMCQPSINYDVPRTRREWGRFVTQRGVCLLACPHGQVTQHIRLYSGLSLKAWPSPMSVIHEFLPLFSSGFQKSVEGGNEMSWR